MQGLGAFSRHVRFCVAVRKRHVLIWMLFANPLTSTRYLEVSEPLRSLYSRHSPMPPIRRILLVAMAMLAAWTVAASTLGRPPWYEGFEGPEPTWRDLGGDARYQIVDHRRVQGEAHTGDGCERLTIAAGQGTYVHVGHSVGRPSVIDDLLLTVGVKSDRPGIQFLARVVLPRTADPRTGQPAVTL